MVAYSKGGPCSYNVTQINLCEGDLPLHFIFGSQKQWVIIIIIISSSSSSSISISIQPLG